MKKLLILLMMLAMYGCEKSAETPEQPASEGRFSQSGTVLETIDVESYTYIRLQVEDSEIWLASNPVSVSDGEEISFSDAILMKNFHSKAMDRTFEDIFFVGNVESMADTSTDKASTHESDGPTADPHANLEPETKAAVARAYSEIVSVQPLEGGKTIAELFAEHGKTEGQEVSLRAKVVKFSPNILGKNWVTLQDGTGEKPNNQLVVTTADTVEIGDEVVVKGKVKSNVDIGAGYAYKLILEEANFSR